jgi:acid phosphatase type 7
MTISWRTDTACTSTIRYGLSDTNLNNVFTNINLKTNHSITLTGLQPNTKYYYQLAGNAVGFTNGPNYHFRTAPNTNPEMEQPIRFWAFGDISKQTAQQVQVRESFLQHKGSNYIDGWLLLGDNAYESGLDIEYQNGFFNYYQNQVLLNTPLFPALGNHDYANNPARQLDHLISYLDIFHLPTLGQAGGIPSGHEEYYSFNYGNIHMDWNQLAQQPLGLQTPCNHHKSTGFVLICRLIFYRGRLFAFITHLIVWARIIPILNQI